MSLRFVLLGLLAENSHHGYGLRKQFMYRLGHFRKINEGQLYTELGRMEREGLVEREVHVPERGPARKIFHITGKGRDAFAEWVQSGVHEDEGLLYDFMQGYPFFWKCSFFSHVKPEEVLAKIDAQLAIVERRMKAYEEILEGMRERKVDRFRIRILEFGLDEMDLRARWLQNLRRDVKDGIGFT